MHPLAQLAAARAGGLCLLPSEHGLEARDLALTFQAVLEGNGGAYSGARERALKAPSCPTGALWGCTKQSPGSACAHHLALALFQSFNPNPEFSPSGELCSSLKEWPKDIWK